MRPETQTVCKAVALATIVCQNIYIFSASNRPERSVELEAFAAVVRNNIYNFNVGMRATTQNVLPSRKILQLLIATASLISVSACEAAHS
jgi:hypothetical protein